MNNIFFKTLFKKGAKGDKGERGINYEVPANAIIGFDDDDGEGGTLPTPAGYDDATLPPYLVEKTIKANGVYDPTNDGAFGYSNVNVDVDGETITLVSKNITANGNYSPEDDNADGYSGVNVHVINPQTILVPKIITENGTYNPADDNADGYSSVEVNVASGGSGGDLDPNYNYYQWSSAPGRKEIVVRVYHEGQNDEEIVWFFKNFYPNNDKGSGRQSIPTELAQYYTSGANAQSAKMYTANTNTVIGWMVVSDYLGGTINCYSTNYQTLLTGHYDAMVVMGDGTEQDTVYTDPYVYL